MNRLNEKLVLENATIWGRNFEGREGKFNAAGKRNFCVTIDDGMVEELKSKGWNIRQTKPRDDYQTPIYYLPVNVSFSGSSPKICLVSSKGKTYLDENTCKIIDTAEIAKADIVINPYNYNVNGSTGVSAYLKTIYVVIAEDEFAQKYEKYGETNAATPDASGFEISDDEKLPF